MYCVYISLMNDNIVELDFRFFTSNNQAEGFRYFEDSNLLKYYKPYYYEFYAEIPTNEYHRSIELTNFNWFKAQLLDIEDWNSNEVMIKGVVEFSASPFVESGMCLKYNTKAVDAATIKKLEGVYTFSNSIEICSIKRNIFHTQLNNAFGHCKDIHARVYDVGQASCVYLFSNIKSERNLFDIVIPRDPEKRSDDRKRKPVKNSMKSAAKFVPELLILSHWDMDHIKGAFLLKQTAFDQYWIAPSFIDSKARISQSVKMLARYLDFNGKLLLVSDLSNGDLIWGNCRAGLWKGKGMIKGNKLSAVKNMGLLLQLYGSDGTTILSGDCEYLSWPDMLDLKDNKYLVVPHHGSKLNDYSKLSEAAIHNDAYISVGEDGDNIHNWDHPSDEHVKKLKKSRYRVISTLNGASCIIQI